jgi:asparagine synthase (glutamine-hydrolysing)
MCRIAGYKLASDLRKNECILNIDKMLFVLKNGGPDGSGKYIDESDNVILGHVRLSILDLSELGSQPMIWNEWVISFNGEIYNFLKIKLELIDKGYSFFSNSDTEVIIKSFDCWGLEAVDKFRGMFAFALWNRSTKKLILCRDRLGVKPLYYYQKDDVFMFSSELKGFYQNNFFDRTINREGLPHYFKKGFFHEDYCIFHFVKKLKPGTFLIVDEFNNLSIKSYWDSLDIFNNTCTHFDGNEHEVVDELEKKLIDSVNLRLVSDVDVGVLLSGGIDSSLVACLAQSLSNKKIKTFNIGFDQINYDESNSAKFISEKLGTDHYFIKCNNNELLDAIDDMSEVYDEPFGDASSLPTILVSRLASEYVKVVLSGDGGDELFGGYSRYKFILNNNKYLKIPLSCRKFLHKVSNISSFPGIESFLNNINSRSYSQIGDKLYKFRETLLSSDIDDLFERTSSFISNDLVNSFCKVNYSDVNIKSDFKFNEIVNYIGLKDINSYLVGDILTKVDRASMSCGLEAREPLLDHTLVEFSFNLIDEVKISKKWGTKAPLKKILDKYIPKEIFEKPKQGFTIPLKSLINTHLVQDLKKLQNDSFFFEKYSLNKEIFTEYLNKFFKNDLNITPSFIWFTYVLYKWDERWN